MDMGEHIHNLYGEEIFERELLDSLYIHKALPLHKEKSLEAELAGKKVTAAKDIWPSDDGAYTPAAQMEGKVFFEDSPHGKIISLQGNLTADHWPEGAPVDGDYTNYGTAGMTFRLAEENWENYHRLHFEVYPKVRSGQVLHLNVSVTNEGETKVPDPYDREGTCVFDLKNEEWNDCIWEFPSMGRDKVTELSFFVYLSGQAAAWKEKLIYDIGRIRLERVENPEPEKGWECGPNRITLSTAGYFAAGRKEAVANVTADRFQVIRARGNNQTQKDGAAPETGEMREVSAAPKTGGMREISAVSETGVREDGTVALEGTVRTVRNERGNFQVLDFSAVTEEGLYYLRAGDVKSPVFPIASDFCEEAVWKIINFVYNLRCGMPIPGKHGACHLDSLAEHNGVKLSFAGGWHDAGDLSQQTAQTGEMVHALFEAAEHYRHRPLLRNRLLEEAQWGLDFILRTRFGDGFRATSAGATRFTQNKMGDFDDVAVRVFDHSYENFLFAGVEAYAAYALRDGNAELGRGSLTAAKEDFAFAERKFAGTGVDPAHRYEHTYHSGRSQYYAVIAWSAANLYRASGEDCYADKAAEYGEKLIACQDKGEAGLPFGGFFYRDESRRVIVHFNHQSREHQFMQALVLLCEVLPEHEDCPKWREAVARYAEYQKAVIGNTAPYGMMPAGVHRMDEPEDKELFPYLHLLVDYDREYPHYCSQLLQGKKLDNQHVLKNFPVWFSFRGNSAVLLSSGIAAAQAGRCLGDETARQIGREQLYWMWGKNPFGQSLQYGVGSRYCSQYGVYVGECAGEVPVGIETCGDEDIPYWPQNNNATFKEVWIGTACRMLWLITECMSTM